MGVKKITKEKRELIRLIELLPNTETIFLKATTEMINFRSELQIPKGSSLSDSLNTPTPDIDNYVRNPYE